MYGPEKGNPPSAPPSSQPGFAEAYLNPPPYATGGLQIAGSGPAYPPPPSYGIDMAQTSGNSVAYPTPPPYGIDMPQPSGARRPYPLPSLPGQPTGVGVAYPNQPPVVIGGAPPSGAKVVYPAPGPPPAAVGGAATTVVVSPVPATVMVGTTFADTPASCVCPVCRQQIVSRIEYKNGLLVWAIFGTLIFLGCWLGCCLIPFCMDSCKDVDHYCPSCNHHLSKYKKL